MRAANTRASLVLVMVCALDPSAWAHKVLVHDAITKEAFERAAHMHVFVADFQLQRELPFPEDVYDDYTSSTGIFGVYEENLRRKYSFTPAGLLRLGSVMEDSDKRFLHHFYEPHTPTTGTPLTESGLLGGSDAQTWAFDSADNQRSWSVAHDLCYQSLTAVRRQERDTAAAELFYTLGHVVHLVQDMSQPSHVRDDAHAGHWYGGPSLLEEWGKEYISQVRTIVGRAGTPKWRSSSRAYLRDLAHYSTENFFSDDTVPHDPFCASGPQWCTYPPNWLLEDHLANEPGPEFDELRAWLVNNHPPEGEAVRVARLKPDWSHVLMNIEADDIDPQDVAHRDRFFEFRDDEVVAQNASLLLPQAVEYSAGMLDFFFRARVSIAIEAVVPFDDERDEVTYVIENVSVLSPGATVEDLTLTQFVETDSQECTTPGAAGFRLFAEDVNGNYTPCGRLPVSESAGVAVLAPGKENAVRIKALYPKFIESVPTRSDRRTIIAYDGMAGNERVIAGAVSRTKRDFSIRLSGGMAGSLSAEQFISGGDGDAPPVPPGFPENGHLSDFAGPAGYGAVIYGRADTGVVFDTVIDSGELTGTADQFEWTWCGMARPVSFGPGYVEASHCLTLQGDGTTFSLRYVTSASTACGIVFVEGDPGWYYKISARGGSGYVPAFAHVGVLLKPGESLRISAQSSNPTIVEGRLFLSDHPYAIVSRRLRETSIDNMSSASLSITYEEVPGSESGAPLWVYGSSHNSSYETCYPELAEPPSSFAAELVLTVEVVTVSQ